MFYNRRCMYSGEDTRQLKLLKELEEENSRLNKMKADIQEVDIVTPDGQLHAISKASKPDLFWGYVVAVVISVLLLVLESMFIKSQR